MIAITIFKFDTFDTHKFEPLLSEDEHNHANSLSKKAHTQFIICSAVTKCLLASQLNQTIKDITIQKTPLGKPYIDNCPIAFNISHTYPYAAIALSTKPTIGIDIQLTNKPFPQKILKKILHPNEISTNVSDKNYDLWSKKEAYIKAKGSSIFQATKLDTTNTKNGWTITNIKTNYPCALAIAYPGSQHKVTVTTATQLDFFET